MFDRVVMERNKLKLEHCTFLSVGLLNELKFKVPPWPLMS